MKFLSSLVLLSVVFAAVHGDGGPQQQQQQQQQQGSSNGGPPVNGKRTLTRTNVDPHRIDIKSDLQDGSGKYGFQYQISTNGLASVRASFFNKSSDTNSGFSFRAAFLRVIESNASIPLNQSTSFISLFGNGDNQAHTDGQNHDLRKRRRDGGPGPSDNNPWSPFIVNDNVTDSGTISNITTVFKDPFSNFTLTLNAFATSTNGLKAGAATLSTSGIHYSLTFRNYPYQYANSSLSIAQGIFAPGGHDPQLDNSTKVVNVGDVAGLTWDTTALADGVSVPVVVKNTLRPVIQSDGAQQSGDDGSKPNDNGKIVMFSFQAPSPQMIYWDPDVALDGSTLATYASSGSKLFTFGWTMVVMQIVLMLIL